MDQYIKALSDRLEKGSENQMRLTVMMDNAINEMHNNGVFSTLPADLQEKIHDKDPETRIHYKTAVAKDFAYHQFIKSSSPVPLHSGGIGYMISLTYDPRFINSICICIQGGVEGLYQSGLYKRNPDEVMNYYIQPLDVGNEDWNTFRRKVLELDSMYENFQLVVMPPKASAPAAASKRTAPAGQNAPAKTAPSAQPAKAPEQAAAPQKKGFFARLFGKK